jgi:hypothetical protein
MQNADMQKSISYNDSSYVLVTMIVAIRPLLFTLCCFFQKKGGETKQLPTTCKFLNKVTIGGSNVGTPFNCFKDDCAIIPHQNCVNKAILEYVIMTKIKTLGYVMKPF